MKKYQVSLSAVLAKFVTFFAGMALSGAVLASAAPQVSLKTSMGEIVLELDQEKAPKTVANFLGYVKSGFYNGTVFHRVIDGFMVQGGGFDAKMQPKRTGKAITSESKNGLKNLQYSVAMARSENPNSATSQFFINVIDNPSLDYPAQDGHGYTVFGKVIKGQEVVQKMKGVLVDRAIGFDDVPVTPIVVKSAKIIKQ
ncbi:peptidyl-prolyl cis-trans isomerase [Massilia sp. RP-1-19]|uniref:Peptidyl-prolyl cis-trans isomerase n=1 Tax=Massilia polaris TaxID=2728846 RepID=A0A848HP21_9BURK|nr:peptidylprolyl isomerase [Massilia polaris]NML61013.1 peptidyl-prolyl cis-trans isomerase [Massilia polaris]